MKDKIHILLQVDEKFEPKAKYIFRTIFRILGYKIRFFKNVTSEEIHIYYGTQTKEKYPIRIYRSIETALFFNKKEMYPEERFNSYLYRNEYIPFLFSMPGDIFSIHESSVFLRKDIIASAFYFISCWQEYTFPKQRFDYKKSLQYRFHFADIPVVERYCELLSDALFIAIPGFQKKQLWNKKYAINLTHDIDYWNFWTKENVEKMDERLLKKMKSEFLPSFIKYIRHSIHKKWNFHHTKAIRKMIQLEKKIHAESSFFLLTKSDFPYPPLNYMQDYFEEIISILPRNRVHLQGSKESAENRQQLQLEFSKLEGFQAKGFRIRYLNTDFQKLFNLLEQEHINFDSSVGFDGIVGFRAGISLPYFPFNIKENKPFNLIEFPVAISDRSFFSLQKLEQKKQFYQMESLFDKAKKHGTLVTIIWHNHVFDPIEFPFLYKLYRKLLKKMIRENAEFHTFESLNQHWINYHKIIQE